MTTSSSHFLVSCAGDGETRIKRGGEGGGSIYNDKKEARKEDSPPLHTWQTYLAGLHQKTQCLQKNAQVKRMEVTVDSKT